MNKVINGDCLEVIKGMDENSIDTIITDPPYGLKFMGKKWDYDVPSVEIFKEMLRVAKPGATLLCFAGSRTQHRMAINAEDAGWILKDCIMWIYGSGFPKATDISKQLDKQNKRSPKELVEFGRMIKEYRNKIGISQRVLGESIGVSRELINLYEIEGNSQQQFPTKESWIKLKKSLNIDSNKDYLYEEAEREIIGKQKSSLGGTVAAKERDKEFINKHKNTEVNITKAATPEAQLWDGWKSHGLKPAYEPILVAMKPNDGTYANNALGWGVSGLNIDGGRIVGKPRNPGFVNPSESSRDMMATSNTKLVDYKSPEGRFPANIILDEIAGEMLDEQSAGSIHSAGMARPGSNKPKQKLYKSQNCYGEFNKDTGRMHRFGDSGGASRFFYCAKSSKAERGEGNIHPTIKPIKLMEYLCKLTQTPTGGLVLDPFGGSGSTGVACKKLERPFILIEREKEYCEIAEKRIEATQPDAQQKLF